MSVEYNITYHDNLKYTFGIPDKNKKTISKKFITSFINEQGELTLWDDVVLKIYGEEESHLDCFEDIMNWKSLLQDVTFKDMEIEEFGQEENWMFKCKEVS